MKIIDPIIKDMLRKKGYKWETFNIRTFATNYYEIKLDGKLVEIYDIKKKAFVD